MPQQRPLLLRLQQRITPKSCSPQLRKTLRRALLRHKTRGNSAKQTYPTSAALRRGQTRSMRLQWCVATHVATAYKAQRDCLPQHATHVDRPPARDGILPCEHALSHRPQQRAPVACQKEQRTITPTATTRTGSLPKAQCTYTPAAETRAGSLPQSNALSHRCRKRTGGLPKRATQYHTGAESAPVACRIEQRTLYGSRIEHRVSAITRSTRYHMVATARTP